MKSIIYCGRAAKDIGNFDTEAKQRILKLLDKLRFGFDLLPKDFKYMSVVGEGVYELRIRTVRQHRIFYVAKFEKAIYVLHAFIKKTQRTSQHDIKIGMQWYKTVTLFRY
jgi:phage-related protein